MSQKPGSYGEYVEGLFELVRQDRLAREAGEEVAPWDDMAYSRAMVARGRFLDAVNRLETSPGVTAAEAEQVGAGILALADVAPDCGG